MRVGKFRVKCADQFGLKGDDHDTLMLSTILLNNLYTGVSLRLRNREIEIETLIFAPISLSYIKID